jgi:DNA invertase Pin-like site-specific DNA recombinase
MPSRTVSSELLPELNLLGLRTASLADDLSRPVPSPKPLPAYVAYYRVSTPKQALGLEAQKRLIASYLSSRAASLMAEFEEIGPATDKAEAADRKQPILFAALAACRSHKATLLVARIDRLSRSAALIGRLLEEGPPVIAVETPNASLFVLQIYSALAEHERRRISARIKAAIAAAKAQGRNNPHAPMIAARMREAATARAEALRAIVEQLHAEGHRSFDALAAELNAKGILTIRDGCWSAKTVGRLVHRLSGTYDPHALPGRRSPGPQVLRGDAIARATKLRPVVTALQARGIQSGEALARALNDAGVPTPRRGRWHGRTARLLVRRLEL